MNSQRFIPALYVVVLTILAVVAGSLLFDAHAEYRQLKKDEAALAKSLAAAEAKLQEQKVILERLRTDPAFVEKVIRQKLDYAKPDDAIFRFKD